jgi:hypothetical protein
MVTTATYCSNEICSADKNPGWLALVDLSSGKIIFLGSPIGE